ncbi:cytochrome P450 2G1-like protein [Labeo rohita]|uniref:Cytochrome P450 2G1-like protein n=1 Tax=Labeo rohita TaxID=84645 RepID=A0A498P662_LABRO|nr:cytochrome P450 2G1-like protein [Labeo rohita]
MADVDKARFLDAPVSQAGLFGDTVEDFAQQFSAVQKQTEAISHILPRREKDDPDTEFHKNNLMATALNLFTAGTETTSTTLRYALMLLIKYPHVQVQRYLDIVPLNVPHYAMKDITFRGYAIPKGTVIIPMLHSVLRDEGQWETPWMFNPEHFLDANGSFKKNPAFMPFSAGKRSCVGESLARMELFLFIVSLLQRFSFSSPKGPDGVDPSPELSSFANMPRLYQLIASPR